MILVGENINMLSKSVGPILKERSKQALQDLAQSQVKASMDYLDVNIGPARKDGPELMEWAVTAIQETVAVPLSLDTTNQLAMEAGLKVHQGRAIINSISAQSGRPEWGLPLVKKYGATMVGLLWGDEGMPRDANERAALAVDLIYKANQAGISNPDIWIDPIVTPITVEIGQVKACVEFMSMLQELAPECKSIVGLSNISHGVPDHLRPVLNRTYLMMLMKYGIAAAIVDAFDGELIQIARGNRPELVALVHRVMDGERPDLNTLTEEEAKYVKTFRVLLGETLYSHSWLEI